MDRLADGSIRYDNSPLPARVIWIVVLATMAVVLVFAGAHDTNRETMIFFGPLIAFALIMILVQQRRTFLFDRTHATLKWTTKGLFGQTYNEVPFKDIRECKIVGIGAHGTTSYRIVVVVPTGGIIITQSSAKDEMERQAEEIQSLLNQTAGTAEEALF
jgi:hypothetical protein